MDLQCSVRVITVTSFASKESASLKCFSFSVLHFTRKFGDFLGALNTRLFFRILYEVIFLWLQLVLCVSFSALTPMVGWPPVHKKPRFTNPKRF